MLTYSVLLLLCTLTKYHVMRIYGPEQSRSKPVMFSIGYLSSDTVKDDFLNCLYLSQERGGAGDLKKIPFYSLMLLPFSTCHLFDISLYSFSFIRWLRPDLTLTHASTCYIHVTVLPLIVKTTFTSSPKGPERLWRPLSILYSGWWGLFFFEDKMAGAWSWLLTFIQCRDQE
jgi:hypothetical protein